MKVLILGAGVIGVTSAYFLAKKGYDVTVVERNELPAKETSFANGCNLSYSYTDNFATYENLRQVPFLLFEKKPALFIKPHVSSQFLKWNARFLLETTKSIKNIDAVLQMLTESKDVLQEILADLDLDFSYKKEGKLDYYRNKKDFISATEKIKKLNRDEQILSPDECVEKAPILKDIKNQIVGGIFSTFDESGDPYQFSVELSKKLQEPPFNVNFLYSTNIEEIKTEADKIKSVKTDKGELTADKYVVSMGAFSPILLKKIGVNLNIYPLKGFSITIPVKNGEAIPEMILKDHNNKIVFVNLGDRIRIAGKVGLVGYDDTVSENHINDIIELSKKTFPNLDYEKCEKWSGFRPATPSGIPYICGTKYDNLYLNTGQGMLGWTMAPISGKKLAHLI